MKDLGTERGPRSVLVPSAVLPLTSLPLSFREHTWSAGKAGITCGVPEEWDGNNFPHFVSVAWRNLLFHWNLARIRPRSGDFSKPNSRRSDAESER